MESSSATRCKACNASIDTKAARADGVGTCPQCGATLTVFSDDTVAPAAAAEGAAPNGDGGITELRIPGYEMRRQIGRGGMGFVFEARQESLDRPVAIKVLAPHLGDDPQFAARFEAEAAALARLAHPHIVSIYERGRCGDRLYFVMEFVAGDTQGRPVDLKSVIARGPLDDEEARRIIVQVMRALTVAHAEGIVHRDIKPGNILLDRHGNAKVADFGIACFGDTPERERFTQPAAAMGTYDYMAPEQRTDAARSDARADIYSTATMLYEMLTGRVPAGAFQPPSVARRGVHPAWDGIIARGMHPLRDERFPTMTAFLSAVEALEFDAEAPTVAGRTAVPASLFVRCHECAEPVREDAQFCPSCRSPQFHDCAKCGARMRASLNGCEQCGADLQSQRRYERFLGLGKAALNRARIAESVADRIQAAQEAGVALARAKKAAEDDAVVAPLLGEANRIVETLAAKAAADAIQEKRFGAALTLLDAVLAVAPGRADAERIHTKLANERSRALGAAKQLRDAGRPREAVRILSELAMRFTDDGAIAELLRDCERRATGLKAVVRDTIPSLVAEKKWCGVESIVRQLRAENAQVAGLDDLANRMTSILNSVSGAVAQAEAALAAGKFSLAIRAAEAVLERVADHPRATEVRNLAAEAMDGLSDAAGRLQAMLDEGRWFAARHAAHAIPVAARSRSAVAGALRRADEGVELANRHAALAIVAGAAAAAMLAAAFVAGSIRDGLTNAMRPIEAGSALFGHAWPAAFALLAVPLGAAVGSAVAMAAALGRPVGRWAVTAALAAVPCFCMAALFFATEHRWDWAFIDLLDRLGRVSPLGFPSLQTLQVVAANAALWIGCALAIALCLAGMRGSAGAPAWRAAVVAGSAATIAAVFAPDASRGPTSAVSSAMLIMTLTVFSGRADRKAYIAAMIVAGVLVGGCTSLLDQRMKWLAPVLTVPAMFVVQTAFTRPRSIAAWLTDALLVLITVLGAAYLQHPLLRIDDAIYITPDAVLVGCALAAGVLSVRLALRNGIDRRLHVADRFATRQWTVRSASPRP